MTSCDEHGDRVVRPEPDLVGDLVRPADDQAVHVREALTGGERRATVDDDGLEAELAREAHERPGDLDAADDDQARPDREDLDEQRAATELDRPRQAALEGGLGGGDQLGVELGRAERPVSEPSSATTSSAAGGAPSPGCVRRRTRAAASPRGVA